MSTSDELMMKKPSLKIKGIPQSDYTIAGVLAALRNFISTRFKENDLPHMTRAAGEKWLTDRAQAFTILGVLERQPNAQITFAMGRSNYYKPQELTLSGYRLPDEYHPVLIHAINEEIVHLEACKVLIRTEDDMVVAQRRIDTMLAFLKEIGVAVGDDYVSNLMADTPMS